MIHSRRLAACVGATACFISASLATRALADAICSKDVAVLAQQGCSALFTESLMQQLPT